MDTEKKPALCVLETSAYATDIVTPEEFKWNFKRLIREGHPQGLPIHLIEEQYEHWFKDRVSPKIFNSACETWVDYFSKEASLKRTFHVFIEDQVEFVRVKRGSELSMNELRVVFRLTSYRNAVATGFIIPPSTCPPRSVVTKPAIKNVETPKHCKSLSETTVKESNTKISKHKGNDYKNRKRYRDSKAYELDKASAKKKQRRRKHESTETSISNEKSSREDPGENAFTKCKFGGSKDLLLEDIEIDIFKPIECVEKAFEPLDKTPTAGFMQPPVQPKEEEIQSYYAEPIPFENMYMRRDEEPVSPYIGESGSNYEKVPETIPNPEPSDDYVPVDMDISEPEDGEYFDECTFPALKNFGARFEENDLRYEFQKNCAYLLHRLPLYDLKLSRLDEEKGGLENANDWVAVAVHDTLVGGKCSRGFYMAPEDGKTYFFNGERWIVSSNVVLPPRSLVYGEFAEQFGLDKKRNTFIKMWNAFKIIDANWIGGTDLSQTYYAERSNIIRDVVTHLPGSKQTRVTGYHKLHNLGKVLRGLRYDTDYPYLQTNNQHERITGFVYLKVQDHLQSTSFLSTVAKRCSATWNYFVPESTPNEILNLMDKKFHWKTKFTSK